MNALSVGHAGLDDAPAARRSRRAASAVTTRLRPTSTAESRGRRRPPLAQPDRERPRRRRRRARPRVVEREERRRAAERRRHGVLEEAVRLRVRRRPGCGCGRRRRPAGRAARSHRRPPAPSPRGPDRSASIAVIRPPSTATSATREPGRRDDRAAADDEVAPPGQPLGDLDLLGALPEAPPADLAQPLLPAVIRQDRREVVRRPAGRPSTRSCTTRTGRRSRTR